MRRDDVIDERVAVVARESCLLMRDEKRWLPEQRETRVLKNLSYENVTFEKIITICSCRPGGSLGVAEAVPQSLRPYEFSALSLLLMRVLL